ncbi:hypothetical protein VTK26DRAFT_6577 [Humicola hyalothermophila]
MGRPADENLPEVVQNHPPYHPPTAMYQQQPYPEVVPDSSPEAYTGNPPYYAQQQEKYPAYYDNAPKLPHDPYSPVSKVSHPAVPGMQQIPGSPYHAPPSVSGDPVSAFSPNSSVPWQRLDSSAGADDQRTYVNSEPEQEKRIFGLRRKIFLIIVGVLAVVIIAAAVGGGVGAAMRSRDGDDDSSSSEPAETAAATSSASETSSTSSPTSTATSTTTSSTPSPTSEILTNDMLENEEFGFQAFSGENFTGKRSPIYKQEGRYDFGFDAQSYLWYTKNWACCHTYCADEKTATGYYCSRRVRNSTDNTFPRVAIWCGGRETTAKDESWKEKCSPPSTTTEIERRSLFSWWFRS